jgi:hypothetical protein
MFNDKEIFTKLDIMIHNIGQKKTAELITCSQSHVSYIQSRRSCSPRMEKEIKRAYEEYKRKRRA